MRSFGIYFKNDSSQGKNVNSTNDSSEGKDYNPTEVHVNLLKIRNQKGISYYLDFGLFFSIAIKELRFYFPFYIYSSDIVDLGNLLAKNNDVLCLIFHANMSASFSGQNCYTHVRNLDDNSSFVLYQLGESNLEVVHTQIQSLIPTQTSSPVQGTILNIRLKGEYSFQPPFVDCKDCTKKEDNKPERCYIRFRVPIKDINSFKHSANISDDFFQSAFSKIDMIDFRINDRREIDKKVLENLREGSFSAFQFNEAHFFYVADSKENIRNGSVIHKDCRIMERERWKDYFPETENINYLAYHWEKRCKSDKDNFTEFCIFFNTIYPERNWLRILLYIFVVILLSFVGSMLSFEFDCGRENILKILIVLILSCFVLWQFFTNKDY